ncbi:hypothetical protein [Pectobacterium wasabiae]|nr:hypothetical protein [Pectobacterium wasabiae]
MLTDSALLRKPLACVKTAGNNMADSILRSVSTFLMPKGVSGRWL